MIGVSTKARVRGRIDVGSLIGAISFCLWLLLYFSSLPLYIQVEVFGHKIISVTIIMAAWVLFAVCAIAIQRRVRLGWLQWLASGYLVYLVIILALHLLVDSDGGKIVSIDAYIFSVRYILLWLVLLIYSAHTRSSESSYVGSIVICFGLISFGFGVWQILHGYALITQEIFLRYSSNVPYDFYGRNRPYAFFTESSNFGWFMAFVFCYAVLSRSRAGGILRRAAYSALASIACIGVILSFTRIAILTLVCAIVFIVFLGKWNKSKSLKLYLPIVFLVFAMLLFYFANGVAEFMGGAFGSLANSGSTLARQLELKYYTGVFWNSGPGAMLLGLGPEMFDLPRRTGLFVDNSYLYILLQQGLVGLLLWVLLGLLVWLDLVLRYLKNDKPLLGAVLAVWSTWLAVGVFATAIDFFVFLAILFYLNDCPRKY